MYGCEANVTPNIPINTADHYKQTFISIFTMFQCSDDEPSARLINHTIVKSFNTH